ncbi:MAG: DUF5654 family protein [Methanomethylophilus sp.]|jgi:TctA family transporter
MADEPEVKPFRLQFLESLSALLISAFGLVAALAWNDAIQSAVKALFDDDDSLVGKTIYALLVTCLAVAMTMLITRATYKTKTAMANTDAKIKEKKEQRKKDKDQGSE